MVSFVGGKSGQGWGIYAVNWDGSDLRCLTHSIDAPRPFYVDLTRSPDGQSLAFTYKQDLLQSTSQVCCLSLDRSVLQELTPEEGHHFLQSWLEDGDLAFIQVEINPEKEDGYLCRMRPDGTSPRRLFCFRRYRGMASQPDSYEKAVLSPDGRRVALVDQKSGRLFLSPETMEPRMVASIGARIGHLAWGPDSCKLAVAGYTSITARLRDLFVVDVETDVSQPLGKVAAESSFNWSPEGDCLAVVRYGSGEFDYSVVDVESGATTPVAPVRLPPDADGWIAGPVWSAKGDRLVMIQASDRGLSIQGVDVETGQLLKLVREQDAFTQLMYLAAD